MKSLTIQVEKVENGYTATINTGGRFNPVPLGKSRFIGSDLDKLLNDVVAAAKEKLS